MILIDANLLLYAYNKNAEHHAASRAWFESALSGSQLVRLAWVTIWAFLRITTNPRIFSKPLTIGESQSIVVSWLDQPMVGILDPGDRYWEIFCRLMKEGQAFGALVMDAALAALAVEHGATLYTCDRDFLRFKGLKLHSPID